MEIWMHAFLIAHPVMINFMGTMKSFSKHYVLF